MPGCGENCIEGQKQIEGGGNKQNRGNDSLITEKSGDAGVAKPATKEFSVEQNIPIGQKVY